MFKLAEMVKRKGAKTKPMENIANTDGPPEPESLKPLIVDAIKTVYDPEIPVNIYDLGLIYNIDVDENYHATVNMTLTAPACPVAESMPQQVQSVVANVAGVSDAEVKLVWDPPWSMDKMTDEARLELGLM